MAVESAVAYTDLRMLVDVDPPQYKYEANRTYRTVSNDDDIMFPVSFVDPGPISRSQVYKTSHYNISWSLEAERLVI